VSPNEQGEVLISLPQAAELVGYIMLRMVSATPDLR